MALLDILKLISADSGLPLDDAGQKALLIARVNEAAKEIYEREDLPEALKEEIFDLNVDSQLVALPWYVEYIRGWRYFESRYSGELADKRNRYRDGVGNEMWLHRWRHVKYSPFQRDIQNESVLRLTIPEPESQDLEVSIIGATTNSSRVQETVKFLVGETEKITTGNFKDPVINILKSFPSAYDMTIYDVEDNILAVIPNHRLYSFYHIVQIFDTEAIMISATASAVEILFKQKYSDMINDYDEFLYGDKYDKAIFWKYKSHKSENVEAATAYELKCQQVLNEIASNIQAETKTNIGFTRNPYFRLPYGAKYQMYRYYPFLG